MHHVVTRWMILVGAAMSWTQASPAFQIDLTQKGYTQFIEFDAEVPPLSEFTFCARLRTTDVTHHQPIFTYLVEGNEPLMSIWLEAGGGDLHTRLGWVGAKLPPVERSTPVDWGAGVWRHLCFSWQAAVGAWALYQDGQLLLCEASDQLVGYIFPGGGRILLGYGISDITGRKNGWEGNIYDFNMILSSTIERKNSFPKSIRLNNKYTQNIIDNHNNYKYVVIEDLNADHTHEVKESDGEIRSKKANNNYSRIEFTTPFSHVAHEVGKHLDKKFPPKSSKPPTFTQISSLNFPEREEPELFDLQSISLKPGLKENNMAMFWKIMNKAKGNFRTDKIYMGQQSSGTQAVKVLSEFETPPPPFDPVDFTTHLSQNKLPVEDDFSNNLDYAMEEKPEKHQDSYKSYNMSKQEIKPETVSSLSEIETPPSPVSDDKVYGHWTGSDFAGTVLGFLKNSNIKSVPKTIYLNKITESHPYASETKVIATVPSMNTRYHKTKFGRPNFLMKRYPRSSEINVKIMGESIRNIIAQKHATERAVNVEISHRGEVHESAENIGHREDAYANQDEDEYHYHNKKGYGQRNPEPFRLANHKLDSREINIYSSPFESNNRFKLPKQGFTDYEKYSGTDNLWQKIRYNNNDIAARGINDLNLKHDTIEDNIFSDNVNQQSLPRLSFQHSPPETRNRELNKNRIIAHEISKLADYTKPVLPFFRKSNDHINKLRGLSLSQNNSRVSTAATNAFHSKLFSNAIANTAVKLGNALNEHFVIGKSVEDKQRSFVGGDDTIPDIHRHRSDIDGDGDGNKNSAPPSLGPRVCAQSHTAKNRLYVQNDGSIDFSHRHSSVKYKSPGLQLLENQFKSKCKHGYLQQHSDAMLIRWTQTPVRIFGGGKLTRTKDYCP